MYLFATTEGYRAYGRSRHSFRPNDTGFYSPDLNLILVYRESGLGTATHELVHHFIDCGFVHKPPLWADEGIANFFEKFIGHVDNDGDLHISFGYFSNWRFPVAQAFIQEFTLEDLFSTEDPCMARCFMLFLHRRGHMQEFVRRLHQGRNDVDPKTILADVVGMSLPELQTEWQKWVVGQPLDDNVNLVPAAFVKTESEWSAWWQDNKERLVWDEEQKLYLSRGNSTGRPDASADAKETAR